MRYALVLLSVALLYADPAHPIFATYLGGGGSEVVGSVTTDSQGNVYIAGRTDSPDFPLKNPIQPVSKSFAQIFIAKFSPTGDLLFSTYFGGTANDLATGIAVDPAGNIYVTGALQSTDFPVTNAFQPRNGGAVDAFVLKLDPSFQVIYSTYVGGQRNDVAMAIAADAQGNAYITGRTESPDFPVTAGAFDPTVAGYQPRFAFVDGFVAKLDPAGNLVYSTFLGGSAGNIGYGIAVDSFGQAHVVGDTASRDFPVAGNPTPLNNGHNIGGGFLSKLSADGSSLIYSTVIGGPPTGSSRAIAIDANDNAYVTGITANARLPIAGGTQTYLAGDVYLVSTDGGVSFAPRRTGMAAAQTTVVAFDAGSQPLQYAGTLQGVFRSVDGGTTWVPAGLDSFNIQTLAVDPSQPGTLYAAAGSGGGLFRSSDAGDTWIPFDSGHPGATITSIAVDPAGSGTLYVVAGDNGSGIGIGQPVYRVIDGGATWTPVGQGLSTAVQALAVSPMDSTPFSGTARFVWVNQIFGGLDVIPGTVYRRMSDAWVDAGLNDDIHALAFNGSTLYAAGQKFYQSTDGAQSWTSTPLPANAVATQIAVDTRNPSTIYLRSGFPNSQLLRSDDGGQSFQIVNTASITSIAVSPIDSSLHAGTTATADAYVIRFDPTGTLLYSNFIGTTDVERGEGIAVDSSGTAYIVGFRGPGNFALPYTGSAFVARADGSAYSILGPSTTATVLSTPSHGIAIAPDGSIVVVMIATTPGLPTQNAVQTYLNGGSDVYLVKFQP